MDEDVSKRFERLEESQMFVERRMDELAEQMAGLERALSAVVKKIEAVERLAEEARRPVSPESEPEAEEE